MPSMSRTVGALVSLAVLGIIGLQARQSAAPSVEPVDRRLLDQYCVSCHNEHLKTADLMLDKVDLSHVGANAKVLEKVALKLRSGQMPPQGRPRPDKASVDTFVTALEIALDRSAAPS